MSSRNKRFVFVEYEDLKRLKFKKLERVSDRIYVLVDAQETNIPLTLVYQTQRLGKRLRWVPIENPQDEDMSYHIAFIMGQLHEKADKDIEFAVLSNDIILDPLIDFINQEGRNCLRVKRKKTSIEKEITESIETINKTIEPPVKKVEILPEKNTLLSNMENVAVNVEVDIERTLIEETARETVKRLIRSGNRPSDVSLLKSYILLHNQELTEKGNIDKIIERLEETKEIVLQDQDVVYNF